jgi:hypothetical protein
MKNTKILLMVLIALTLSFVMGIAAYASMTEIRPGMYFVFGAFGLIVIISIWMVFGRLNEEKKGLVSEDELSERIKNKAAANAFTGSFYLWTMILMFTIDSNIDREVLFGIGIAGMGLLFLGFWFYQSRIGIENEDPN